MSEAYTIIRPAAPMHAKPSADSGLETEALFGESVTILDRSAGDAGWLRVRLMTDGYEAWLKQASIADENALPKPTHWVSVPRTIITSSLDVKSPSLGYVPLGGRVAILDEVAADGIAGGAGGQGRFGRVALPKNKQGYIPLCHLLPLGEAVADWVAVAESLLGVPYKWGGRDSLGVDCSALIQLGLASGGVDCPRNSGDQAAALGVDIKGDLQRGDLIFWAGHVGVMRDSKRLLHANAWHNMVASEDLAAARRRIKAQTKGDITRMARIRR